MAEAGRLRAIYPWGAILRPVERREIRELVHGVFAGFGENDLLTFASVISFQVMTAVIPLLMFGLALLGVLNLRSAWSDHLAPQLKSNVSPDVFHLVDHVCGSLRLPFLAGAQLDALLRRGRWHHRAA